MLTNFAFSHGHKMPLDLQDIIREKMLAEKKPKQPVIIAISRDNASDTKPERTAAMMKMRKAGYSLTHIGKEFGVSYKRVSQLIRRGRTTKC